MAKKPHVVMLLDASGSMGMHRDEVVSTTNAYIKDVIDAVKSVSIYSFDALGRGLELFEVRFKDKNPQPISLDDYEPRGGTPLYDAIGTIIGEFAGSKRPVQLIIHTDGAENASREFSFQSVNQLLDKMKEKGWLVTFLAEGLSGQAAVQNFGGLKVNMNSSASRGAGMTFMAETTTMYAASSSSDAGAYTKDGSDKVAVD